ncbi:hypothetical protein [Pseudoduganella dura]|uniref:hypothetical protein n=1 Tax=Pseudoduganella dura TaxID=321982 RepID=UPI0019BC2806|nr:hypothetical protein [Pseudoduganella dura]GGX92724.1 hypothetical protein GCM10007386_24540 [Pseudoduganella dura]
MIDFDYDGGKKAVGYVMGLNSVTDYWDTGEHQLDDPRREAFSPAQVAKSDMGNNFCKTFKPFRDYACRIDCGGALIGLYNNFVSGWNRAGQNADQKILPISLNFEAGGLHPPAALLHSPGPEDSTVQIIRTQPTERDHTIQEIILRRRTMLVLRSVMYILKINISNMRNGLSA